MSLIKPKDWKPQGVDTLEPNAWQALREAGNVCVTAGAGAGKTEFLAQKAAYLLQTGLCPAPKHILALSFKKDAAKTLGDRVEKRCGRELGRRFASLTFDAFAKSLVDQFRMALPEFYRPLDNYQITYPGKKDIEEFLDRHGGSGFSSDSFRTLLLQQRLQDNAQSEITKEQDTILNAYWQEQKGKAFLSFPMINRLAEYLLRTNAYIRRAVQITYPIVFLDEFQDITGEKYELLQTAFAGANPVLTAVGDEKQRIMGWAGALSDSFEQFKRDYSAKLISLQNNYRSHLDLVAIQNIISANFYPSDKPAIAQAQRTVAGDVAARWHFTDRKTESKKLAQWIAAEIRKGLPAHEIAILVRNKANDAEKELKGAFDAAEVKLRNLARDLGGISIEDLLSEELTGFLLPFLRLATEKRAPDAWAQALENMAHLLAVDSDDEDENQRLIQKTESVIKNIRSFLNGKTISDIVPQELVQVLIDEIGERLIRQAVPNYSRDADFLRVKNGFIELLTESLQQAPDWRQALDYFEGLNQVQLLTTHKSKGMEFHTMIFYGLDNKTWWNLMPTKIEEKNAFYVTFTRAKQRAFFTYCRDSGGRPFGWLDSILGSPVPRIDGNSII